MKVFSNARLGGSDGTSSKCDTPQLTLSFLPAMMHVYLPIPNASMASGSLPEEHTFRYLTTISLGQFVLS